MKTNNKINKIILLIIPYLFIILFNDIMDFLMPNKNNVFLTLDIILMITLNYFLYSKLTNIYNKLITMGWLAFFFLGLLNINSCINETNFYNLQIHDASVFYLLCVIIFTTSLLLFEKINPTKQISFNTNLSNYTITSSLFSFILYIYPVLLFITLYTSIGFIPILLGDSFVDSMYEYNYGFLYGFKFICVYGFLLSIILFKITNKKLIIVLYILFLLFSISIDGKRFVLLLCLLSFIPCYNWLSKENNYSLSKKIILIPFLLVFLIYIIINAVRTGNNSNELLSSLITKIPFGVEYKDYVHSFNTYKKESVVGYNFELSAIGSFFNSSFLNLLNLNKEQLTKMGSAYVWMDLYKIKFGIRTGIISELYFAYGYASIFIMTIIAYFTNRISQRLINPKSYFNLIQNSILFALFFLLVNGQATVFFGCLSMMLYVFVLFKFFNLKLLNKNNVVYNNPSIK